MKKKTNNSTIEGTLCRWMQKQITTNVFKYLLLCWIIKWSRTSTYTYVFECVKIQLSAVWLWPDCVMVGLSAFSIVIPINVYVPCTFIKGVCVCMCFFSVLACGLFRNTHTYILTSSYCFVFGSGIISVRYLTKVQFLVGQSINLGIRFIFEFFPRQIAIWMRCIFFSAMVNKSRIALQNTSTEKTSHMCTTYV